MKDYYKNELTALTPKRAAAVHAIANRLCAVRDQCDTDGDNAWIDTFLHKWNRKKHYWDTLGKITVGRAKSNSILAEAVHETLPRVLKGTAIVLVVHRPKRVCRYDFSF
jgi:hypothetical protein